MKTLKIRTIVTIVASFAGIIGLICFACSVFQLNVIYKGSSYLQIVNLIDRMLCICVSLGMMLISSLVLAYDEKMSGVRYNIGFAGLIITAIACLVFVVIVACTIVIEAANTFPIITPNSY